MKRRKAAAALAGLALLGAGAAGGYWFRGPPQRTLVRSPLDEILDQIERDEKLQVNPDEAVLVHVTQTGTKYHSAGCRYLKSDAAISLAQAKRRGFSPCSVCSPPQ